MRIARIEYFIPFTRVEDASISAYPFFLTLIGERKCSLDERAGDRFVSSKTVLQF